MSGRTQDPDSFIFVSQPRLTVCHPNPTTSPTPRVDGRGHEGGLGVFGCRGSAPGPRVRVRVCLDWGGSVSPTPMS